MPELSTFVDTGNFDTSVYSLENDFSVSYPDMGSSEMLNVTGFVRTVPVQVTIRPDFDSEIIEGVATAPEFQHQSGAPGLLASEALVACAREGLIDVGTYDVSGYLQVYDLGQYPGTAAGQWHVHPNDKLSILHFDDGSTTTEVLDAEWQQTVPTTFPGSDEQISRGEVINYYGDRSHAEVVPDSVVEQWNHGESIEHHKIHVPAGKTIVLGRDAMHAAPGTSRSVWRSGYVLSVR